MSQDSELGLHHTVLSFSEGRPAPALGAVLGGKYSLVRLLGAGGMGAVYEALTPTGERVAVKVLLDQLQDVDSVRQRFAREIAVTNALQSEHIVPALDAGTDEPTRSAYLVMPLMVGFDLERLVTDTGAVHPMLAARIIRQACAGLEAAHAAGVVHRDIKDANLFLDHAPDGRITVRVLDLGVAKWRDDDDSLTQTGSVLGTATHISPEQIKDSKRVDTRCDVWSLGVTFYQLLAGVGPFDAEQSLAMVMRAICVEPIPPIQQHAPWIDPGLAQIVHGTLLRDPHLRCPSVQALRAALAPFAGDSDELHVAMLIPLPAAHRQQAAPRAPSPMSWQAAVPQVSLPALARGDEDPLLGRTLAGRYTLLRCLGRGGMGAVYEAATPDAGRLAVKVIRPELAGTSRSARRRFVREAKVVQRLESPNVVRVHDVAADAEHELPFMAMELLTGGDLGEALQRHGALRPKVVARLFLQAARGLEAAHAQGFIHRDVKPANLYLALQPTGELCVKICDFGVAKQLEPDHTAETTAGLTRAGSVIGSPMYMSPEQAKNSPDIDARSDVWSLAATMYEALAGEPPWQGKGSMPEIILAVCSEPLTHIQDRAPWVPGPIADVVHKAMQRDPSQRFQSVSEMAAALVPLIGDHADVLDDDIKPVADAVRQQKAARATTPLPLGTEAGTAHTLGEGQRKPVGLAVLLGVVLAAAGGAAVYGWTVSGSEPQVLARAIAEPLATAVAGSETAPVEVRIEIVPPTATVEVDGEPQTVTHGILVVSGAPGQSFLVSATAEGHRVEQRIVVGLDGRPSHDRIAPGESAPAEASASSSTPTKTPPRPAPPRPSGTGTQPPPKNTGAKNPLDKW